MVCDTSQPTRLLVPADNHATGLLPVFVLGPYSSALCGCLHVTGKDTQEIYATALRFDWVSYVQCENIYFEGELASQLGNKKQQIL